MTQVASIKLDTKRLDEIAAKLGVNTEGALRATAFQVEGIAKMLAPVDTGALRNSLHSERVDVKTYMVADGVEYGIYQELGTRKMAAHPFLIPALEQVAKQFGGIVAREIFK